RCFGERKMSVYLAVSARVLSPLALEPSPPFAPLDGLLQRAWVRREKGAAFWRELPPTSRDDPAFIQAPLPLKKVWFGSDWVWAASGAVFEKWAGDTHYWNKRSDAREFANRTNLNRLEIGKGEFKAYHQPLVVTHCDAL